MCCRAETTVSATLAAFQHVRRYSTVVDIKHQHSHIVCIEYDWRQAASEAAAGVDEREQVVMHHIAAWQLHLALSAVDVEWILYSRHIDCYSSPTETDTINARTKVCIVLSSMNRRS